MYMPDPVGLDLADLMKIDHALDEEIAAYLVGPAAKPADNSSGPAATTGTAPSAPRCKAPGRTTKATEAINIRIPHWLIRIIREEAERNGEPYQTLLNRMLAESATRRH